MADRKAGSLQALIDSTPDLVAYLYNDTPGPHSRIRADLNPVPTEFLKLARRAAGLAGDGDRVQSAPGHVAQVRRLVFDQLTAAQVRQLGAIAGKIAGAVRSEMTQPSG